jgi:hypothetical protein
MELYHVNIANLFAVQPTPEQRMKARHIPEAVLYVRDENGIIQKVSRVFVEFEQRLPAAFEEDMDG